MFREDFLKAVENSRGTLRSTGSPTISTQPETFALSSGSDQEITEQQLLRQANFVHEFQRIEDRRGAWQQQVAADLSRAADGSLDAARNIEALKRQMDRMETQLAQMQLGGAVAEITPRSRTARFTSSAGANATDMGGAASADAVSALGALVSATASQLESGFAKRLAEMEQRTNERFADIRDQCVRLQQNAANIHEIIESGGMVRKESTFTLGHALSMRMRGTKEAVQKQQKARDPLTMLDKPAELNDSDDYAARDLPDEDDGGMGAALAMIHAPTINDDEYDDIGGSSFSVSATGGYLKNSDIARCFGVVQTVSSVLILLSLVWMGVSLLVAMPRVLNGDQPPKWLETIEILFMVCFTFELLCRLTLEKLGFFVGPNKYWNAVEVLITGMQLLSFLGIIVSNLTVLRSVRMLRLVRAVRLIRELKSLRYLRQFVAVASCWQPFFWGFSSMFLMTYIFAIVIAQWLTDWRADGDGDKKMQDNPEQAALVNRYYGTLVRTMVSLFMATTGGVEWDHILRPLEDFGVEFRPVVLVYSCIMLIGVMNILTAVYVERFMVASQLERDMNNCNIAAHDRQVIEVLRPMLDKVAQGHNGKISTAGLYKLLGTADGEALLSELKIDIKVVEALVLLLDSDRKGKVSVDEVCFGMLHIKNSVATLQMAMILFQSKRTLARVDRLDYILSLACADGSASGVEDEDENLDPTGATRISKNIRAVKTPAPTA